jgi:uncharacterized protein YcfJ
MQLRSGAVPTTAHSKRSPGIEHGAYIQLLSFTVLNLGVTPEGRLFDMAQRCKKASTAFCGCRIQEEDAMKRKLQVLFAACGIAVATQAAAQITFYEGEGFTGRGFSTADRIWNFDRVGFNDRASSVVVERGPWEVCDRARFEGRCVILRHGSYTSLRQVGLNNRISSARPMQNGRDHGRGRGHGHEDAAPAIVMVAPREQPRPIMVPVQPVAPPPVVVYESRPAFFDVPVTSVRAVVGPPTQRCWIDREQVAQPRRGDPNIGGAVVGGIVGGLLGHQIGGGSGKDIATAGGVIAGAAIGANVNRGEGGVAYVDRDVQRCQTVSNAKPEYWDVTYFHRGVEHRVQMAAAPGATIRINAEGAPMTVAR